MTDAGRLVLGTLTVLPVPAPRRVDRVVAGRAMLLAPVAGLVPAGLAAAVVAGAEALRPDAPMLSATLGIVILVVLCGGLHLDGLADTADGFGSRRDSDERLRIMRRGDVGPFGVAAIVLVLLLDAAALAACVTAGLGWQAVVVAGLASRLTVPWACRSGIPAARPEGLGAAVAATVRPAAVWIVTVAAVAGGAVLLLPHGARPCVAAGAAVLAAIVAGEAVTSGARRAVGGITGDTLGAGVELGGAAALAVLALAL